MDTLTAAQILATLATLFWGLAIAALALRDTFAARVLLAGSASFAPVALLGFALVATR